MIRATPYCGFPPVVVNSDVQSDIEDVMSQMGYGCTEYTLEMVECVVEGDLDALDVLDNFISGIQELRDRIANRTGNM